MMAFLDNKYLCVTGTFSSTRQFNSHCVATDCTNIILPTICLGMVARATTSSETLRQLPGLQFVISGEHKDVDRFRGKPAEDTGITSVFVGPRAVASWRRWRVALDVGLPVLIDNTALQVVPDYRLRGGISLQF